VLLELLLGRRQALSQLGDRGGLGVELPVLVLLPQEHGYCERDEQQPAEDRPP
jgi:hypothetical protein